MEIKYKVYNQARLEKDLKLVDVAKRSGLSKSQLTKLMYGRTELTYSTAVKLARAIGCKPDKVFYADAANSEKGDGK